MNAVSLAGDFWKWGRLQLKTKKIEKENRKMESRWALVY